MLDDWTWAVSGRLHDSYALFKDDSRIGWVIWWLKGWQKGDVDAEWLVGHCASLADLFAKVFGGGLRKGCELLEGQS